MLTLNAPAKINWFLKILNRRDDGYHNIKSLIHKVSLYDTLAFELTKRDLKLESDIQIPAKQNLVYKAAVLLKRERGVKNGARISISKKIPAAAGLGGGSSDAASTLIGLNELWSLKLSVEELAAFAVQIGSDVPFFLSGSLALVSGRGEKIKTVKVLHPFNILLVKPPVEVSTRWVYNSYKLKNKDDKYAERRTENPELSRLTKEIEKVDNITHFIHAIRVSGWFRDNNISNDLESVTIKKFPVIADIKKKLLDEGAVFSMMSGSGPTVFGVFESFEDAKRASLAFRDCWTAVVRTLTD